jgi:hypothetical protein
MGRRFVAGRAVSAVSAVTSAFLRWCAPQAQARDKRAVVLSGDTAAWHDRPIVRAGLRQHNRPGKQTGQGVREGVRVLAWSLPPTSPWLNPIEPKAQSASTPVGAGQAHGRGARAPAHGRGTG